MLRIERHLMKKICGHPQQKKKGRNLFKSRIFQYCNLYKKQTKIDHNQTQWFPWITSWCLLFVLGPCVTWSHTSVVHRIPEMNPCEVLCSTHIWSCVWPRQPAKPPKLSRHVCYVSPSTPREGERLCVCLCVCMCVSERERLIERGVPYRLPWFNLMHYTVEGGIELLQIFWGAVYKNICKNKSYWIYTSLNFLF